VKEFVDSAFTEKFFAEERVRLQEKAKNSNEEQGWRRKGWSLVQIYYILSLVLETALSVHDYIADFLLIIFSIIVWLPMREKLEIKKQNVTFYI